MPFTLQCNVALQDCASLYPSSVNPFTNGSCVRDQRLDGNIGRCGFPGAQCIVGDRSNDNCATRCTTTNRRECPSSSICQNGICMGAAGTVCKDSVDCNWGMSCNSSSASPGVWGGANAKVASNESSIGLDFGKDYCLSGSAYQGSPGSWLCSDGPPMSLTSPQSSTVVGSSSGATLKPTSTSSHAVGSTTGTGPSPLPTAASSLSSSNAQTGPMIGGIVSGVTVIAVLLILGFRKRRLRALKQME